jgi:hypothetical protein
MSSTKPSRGPRKPPPVAVAEAFVAGDAKGEEKAEAMDLGRAKRRITTYFPPELATRLRVRAAKEDRSVTDIVVEAVEKYLGGER